MCAYAYKYVCATCIKKIPFPLDKPGFAASCNAVSNVFFPLVSYISPME